MAQITSMRGSGHKWPSPWQISVDPFHLHVCSVAVLHSVKQQQDFVDLQPHVHIKQQSHGKEFAPTNLRPCVCVCVCV